MATTNYQLAGQLQDKYPHTYAALQKLVMAMADYRKNRGKTTWFGRDKGLKSYKKFESVLQDTLLAMVIDNVIARSAEPETCRESLLQILNMFSQAYPNWQDGYAYAREFFIDQPDVARDRIDDLMRQAPR